MLKNIVKFIAVFMAFLSVFYFFKKIQTKPIKPTTSVEVATEYETSLPDDFYPFYDQFHTDSSFQMNSIVWPLNGIAQSSDTTKLAEKVLWTKNDWTIHTPFDSHEGTFERVFTNYQGIITEQISANQGLFTLEKKYTKLRGKWHLIYYQELIMNK